MANKKKTYPYHKTITETITNTDKTPRNLVGAFIKTFLLTILGCFALSVLMAFPIKWLWNWIMPDFGLCTISVWKAWGLSFLCEILFKGNTTEKS